MEKHLENDQTKNLNLLLETLSSLHLEERKDALKTNISISLARDFKSGCLNISGVYNILDFSEIEINFMIDSRNPEKQLTLIQKLSKEAAFSGTMKTLSDDIKAAKIARLYRQVLSIAYLTIKRELEALANRDFIDLECLNEPESLAAEYHHMLSQLSQNTSDEDLDRMEEILKESQFSPDLYFLITEVDNLVLSENASQSLDPFEKQSALNALKRVFSILKTSKDPELKKQLKTLKDAQKRQKIAIEYFRLLSDSDLDESDSEVDRLCEIMHEAESDDALALILNEVDSLLIQESEASLTESGQIEEYEKFADCFREHVKACSDASVSRLITKLSDMIEKLQAFRSCDTFTDEDTTHEIDEKVYSLEELKKEAEVEQERQIIRDSYECSAEC